MGDYSFTFFGPFIGGISIAIVSCIGCVFGIRRCRRRRELEIQLAANQVIPPPIQVVTYPAPQQQPYVMSYSQPLAPVGYYPYQQQPAGYYPQPSAPMGPVQV